MQDNGGTLNNGVDTSVNANTLTINVTAVNDAPTGTNATITVQEDGTKTFAASDFGFADTNDNPAANALSAVIITALPASGTLKLGTSPVTANQSIAVASLGNLVYAPAANANGSNYATISFKVQDNGGTLNNGVDTSVTANTLTINVTAVNDAPTGGPTFTGSAQVGSTLTAAIGTLADLDGIPQGAITYKWQKSVDGITWTDITTAATYSPVAADFNNLLRVRADYTDGGNRTENVVGTTMAVVAGNAPYVKNVIVDDPNHNIKVVFSEPMQEYASIGNSSIFKTFVDGTQKVMTEVSSSESSGIYQWIESTYTWTFGGASSEVKFTYSDPSGDDPQAVYQDAAGNDAGSFNIVLASMSNSASSITGTSGNDYLLSNSAYHTIVGGQGNDVMWAAGDGVFGSTNSAGGYSDVFKWNSGDAGTAGATETIKDFVRLNGTSGDQLDIKNLLAGGYASGSTLANWVTSITTGQTVNGVANSTVMVIDIDGTASGTVTQVIVLEGVDLLAGLSGTYTTQLGWLKTNNVIIA